MIYFLSRERAAIASGGQSYRSLKSYKCLFGKVAKISFCRSGGKREESFTLQEVLKCYDILP